MEREATGTAGVHDADGQLALEVTGVSKAYGATVALEHADLALRPGHVLALLGENGAGKSTLVRILSGVVSPDTGEMAVHGMPYGPRSITEARASQVATAFQELSLVPNLSAAQNLMLPRQAKSAFGLVSRRRVLTSGEEILSRHGLERIDPDVEVSQLPLSDRQRIEIARAIENAGRVLILDEPTAALAETDWIFEQISKAKQRGVAILYISHRLAEVREICTSATVLRNGRSIATVGLEQATDGDIFEMMVGHRVDTTRQKTPRPAREAKPRVQAKELHGEALNGVSFDIKQGEVLGVAALEGQGQRALFRCLAGLTAAQSGTVLIDGQTASYRSPRQAMKFASGLSYLPEERKTEGILTGLTAATNIVLPFMPRIARLGFVSARREEATARRAAENVEMDKRYLPFDIADLSGGNQQKALMARTLASGAQTLLLFDPTRGVDVGTKESIYTAIRQFAEAGGSVLFYSSELPEIVQLADRCLVLYDGRIAGEFSGDDIAEHRLIAAMVGHSDTEAA